MAEPVVKTALTSAEASAKPSEPQTTAAPIADSKAEDGKVSGRFAALSRKERAIVQKQQDVQGRETALAAREKAVADRESAFEAEWKADPTKAAEKRGLTYAEWTNRVLNDGKPTAESEVAGVREEVARLKKEREDEKEAARLAAIESEKQATEKVITEFKDGVRAFVKGKADDYEFINLHSAQELVITTIEEHFEQTKEILDTKTACDLVEKFLEEQVIKSTETKKFKAKAAPQPKEEPKSTLKSAASQQKTLTNNMTSSAPGFLPAKSEGERLKRAMAALERTKP